ncbi:MAG: hypothetical protein HOH43_27605 [Candidatus Latescibacteria bacterium]|nr:hypothetical protein [Candidatus Latescibacterota bacterium]
MVGQLVDSVRSLQTDTGAWSAWSGGPDDLDATVTSYLALRISGTGSEDITLRAAAKFVEQNGGIGGTDPFTRCLVALMTGNSPRTNPGFLPEMLLLPPWLGNHYNDHPAWARVIALPTSVTLAAHATDRLPVSVNLDELDLSAGFRRGAASASSLSHVTSSVMRLLDRMGVRPWRQSALRASREWLLDRSSGSDGPGASALALVRLMIALTAADESPDAANTTRVLQTLNELIWEDAGQAIVAPEEISVWDTANVLNALSTSGMDSQSNRVLKAASWLLDQEVQDQGEWQIRNPNVRASGWSRSRAGRHYPDVANSGCVLTALQYLRDDQDDDAVPQGGRQSLAGSELLDAALLAAATQRGLAWILSMQNGDGGWSYWDKVPKKNPEPASALAGLSSSVDGSAAEPTALALSALRGFGYGKGAPAVEKALQYLLGSQNESGMWDTPDCNDVTYVTCRVLQSLRGIRDETVHASRIKASHRLVGQGNSDGGWGQGVQAVSNPQSTSWAVMGLLCGEGSHQASVDGGINYLIREQKSDGSWTADSCPAPRAPGLVSYTNDLASIYYPLMALGEYHRTPSE